jgi:hypothetical protein
MADMERDEDTPYTENQILTFHLRTVLCGAGCLPMRETDDMVDKFDCRETPADNCAMTTWIPTEHIFVMVVGTEHGENKVIICHTGDAFTLSNTLQVHTLPTDVAVMCTCTMDTNGAFRVLIYDGYNLPAVQHQPGDPQSDDDTQERYARLRAFVPRFFQSCKAARQTFHLQWVGFLPGATRFLDGGIDVGHPVGGLISLTADPFKPTRPLYINTPSPVLEQFN